MGKFKLTAFWQAVLVVVVVYLILDNAFPPVMPKTLMIQFMAITIVARMAAAATTLARAHRYSTALVDPIKVIATLQMIAWPGTIYFEDSNNLPCKVAFVCRIVL